MRVSILALSLGLALSLLIGCTDEESSTEVIALVDAEAGVREQTASVYLRIERRTGDDGAELELVFEHVAQAPIAWPLKLVLVPKAGDGARLYAIRAEARDEAGEPFVTAQLRSGFVPGERRYVQLLLTDVCRAVAACREHETCHEGGCLDALVDARDFGSTRGAAPNAGELAARSAHNDGGRAGENGGSAGSSGSPVTGGAGGGGGAGADCLPGNKRCVGDELQRCDDDQTGFVFDEACAPGLCDDVGDQCDLCSPGAPSCANGERRRCNPEGQDYVADPCPRPASECREVSCSGAGSCVESDKAADSPCTLTGAQFCDGAGACVECNRDAQCASGHCLDGHCVQCEHPSHCPGDDGCNDPTCSAAGSCGLIQLTGNLCGSGQVCDDGSCTTACGNGRLDAVANEACEVGLDGYTWYTCDPVSCQRRTFYTPCISQLYCVSPALCDMNAQMCLPPCTNEDPGTCEKPQPVLDVGGNPTMICAASKCGMTCMSNLDCPAHLYCQMGLASFCDVP
jgi:hypothetical protein